MAAFSDLLRVRPGAKVDLADHDPNATPGFDGDRDAAKAELKDLRGELAKFQERFWAERTRSMLVVLQAMDAGGKDGTIQNVFTAINPQGTSVSGFGVPTDEELAHDYLWRVHTRTPGKGRIGVFNRSHYEDVLVVRVAGYASQAVWSKRYAQINDWERTLAASGTVIRKFFLHISRDEQRARFQKRLDNPHKQWKFSMGDLKVREQWDDYQRAYADVLERCSTAHAPWFVIPANKKWYRDVAVARVLAETARDLDPRYPPPKDDLTGVVIPE